MADADPALCQSLKTAIGKRQILLAASTHDGEDASMIAAANALGDGWLTIIAPRHPDRGSQIAAASSSAPQRSLGQFPSKDHNLYIMDSFGEMGSLFSLADLVILGGSFMPKGGHNPLEPAAFGLPIITGQHILKTAPNLPAFAMWGLCLMWQKPMMGLMPR
jgi:3-deoxy-D-manno-octulosonic-acid transferase